MMNNSVKPLKILLLGDPGTGKKSYCRALIRSFPVNRQSVDMISEDICLVNMRTADGRYVSVVIYNPTISETIHIEHECVYDDIDGVIIMFDVTNPSSYNHVFQWKNHYKNPDPIPIMILANKSDLGRNPTLSATILESKNFCQALGFFDCLEISTVTGNNISLSLRRCVEQIIGESLGNRPSPTIEQPQNDISSGPTRTDPSSAIPIKTSVKIKIIVLGAVNVGKTSIIERYTNNVFDPIYKQTMGVNSVMKKIKYNESTTVTMFLWDIAGNERTFYMTRAFYKDAQGCIVVFDLTKPLSLKQDAIRWKKDVDRNFDGEDNPAIPCLLLGNKCDLHDQYVVPKEREMRDFCDEHKFIRWFPTSAKTNTNISEAFKFLIKEIIENYASSLERNKTSESIRLEEFEMSQTTSTSICSNC